MKSTLYFKLLFSIFIFFGCMSPSQTPLSKESIARKKILQNQAEAKKAQEEYLTLQHERG